MSENDELSGALPGRFALCLSGGGYRAMLFHLGVLWRLTETGYLPKLGLISSVSGGSITAGMLAIKWNRLAPHTSSSVSIFIDEVVNPICYLASHTVDINAIMRSAVRTRLWHLRTAAQYIADSYDKFLFYGTKLSDLPTFPEFVFNATSTQTGERFTFSRRHLGDKLIGRIETPTTAMSLAVAASSAFPPLLSPLILTLNQNAFTPNTGRYQAPPFTTKVFLTDGGVYDNLALGAVDDNYSVLLVSDGGAHMKPIPVPPTSWPSQINRTIDLIDNQVRRLRRENLFQALKAGTRRGAYWSVGSLFPQFLQRTDSLDCPPQQTAELANLPTRLAKLSTTTQQRLINWGFAVSDAAIRTYLDPNFIKPANFPYPDVGV